MEKKENQKEKWPVPSIEVSTGLSSDYMNEITWSIGYLLGGDLSLGLQSIKDTIKEHTIRLKKYEERFSPAQYENVVNDKNSKAIERINELVDELNRKIANMDSLEPQDFITFYEKVGTLVHGRAWQPKTKKVR